MLLHVYVCGPVDEIMPCVVAWMDLEVVILSDVSQTQKDTYHMTLFICGF